MSYGDAIAAIARRRGKRRGQVAVARRLVMIIHRIWVDGTTFRWARGAVDEAELA